MTTTTFNKLSIVTEKPHGYQVFIPFYLVKNFQVFQGQEHIADFESLDAVKAHFSVVDVAGLYEDAFGQPFYIALPKYDTTATLAVTELPLAV